MSYDLKLGTKMLTVTTTYLVRNSHMYASPECPKAFRVVIETI